MISDVMGLSFCFLSAGSVYLEDLWSMKSTVSHYLITEYPDYSILLHMSISVLVRSLRKVNSNHFSLISEQLTVI